MLAILEYLDSVKGNVNREDHIIRKAFGLYENDNILKPLEIKPSLRTSVSRSLRILKEHGLVHEQRYEYEYEYRRYDLIFKNGEWIEIGRRPPKTWTSRPWFGITEKGSECLKSKR